jgi:TolB-like protein/Flp pilus assembly protein TadD
MRLFWQRIREQKVAQWAVTYLAVAWVLYEALSEVGANFAWPDVVMRSVTVIFLVGLPVILVLAWYHGEKGRHRVSGPELVILLTLLVIAAAMLRLVGGSESSSAAVEAEGVGDSEPAAEVAIGQAPTPFQESVAVMPLDNYGDPDDLLARAVSEEITLQLSQIHGLKVSARTSVEALEGSGLTARQIADTLGVRHLLEGSVQRTEQTVRVTVQLIDALEQMHVWSERYDRPPDDLFAIQEEVASRVAEALLDRVPGLRRPGAGAVSANSEAVESYLRGRYLLRRRTREALLGALDAFERSITLDPAYAPPYAGAAAAHGLWVTYAHGEPWEPFTSYARALAYASRALELDSQNAEAHAALGYVLTKVYAPFSTIGPAFDAALALRPNSADVHGWYAHALVREGHLERALEEAARAVDLDPVAPGRRYGLALDALGARRYELALDAVRAALSLEPSLERPRAIMQLLFLLLDRPQDCVREGREVAPAVWAACLMEVGRRQEGEEVIRLIEEGLDGSASTHAGDMSIFYAVQGNARDAARWLERAFETDARGIEYRVFMSGAFDRVREDGRLRATLEGERRSAWERVRLLSESVELPGH